ncbi:MAG: hypothetical protein GXO67_04345 [Archaeoglobi archaeon]|nr:hypothetical protein [Geoglobus ahangari]NOY11310.1 hypothetical protein [Archaeoglobi archaeon]
MMENVPVEFNCKVLARMLARAYVAEHTETEAISEAMLQLGDDEVSEALFKLIRDNEMHKMMIEAIIERLNFSIDEFKEYSIRTIGLRRFDFSDEFTVQQLNEILKWERWARDYYRELLKQDYSKISEELGDKAVEFIKDALRKLVQWEEGHIKLVENLMSKA